MASIRHLITQLYDKKREVDEYQRIYEEMGDPRAPACKAQHELLSDILKNLVGGTPEASTPTGSTLISTAAVHEPFYARVAAFLTDVRGLMTATLFTSWQEAEEAYHRFDRENEDIEPLGVRYASETVDIGFLSADLLAKPGPQFVHALVTAVRGAWDISLHHRWHEADAVYERLKIEEAEAHEKGDIWSGMPIVALPPEVTQIIIEDLRAHKVAATLGMRASRD
jgi:hypothetical protein